MNDSLSFFADLPIKRKLMTIIMFICSASLLLACVTMLLYERRSSRETLASDFAIIADTFDDNLSSALAFDDPEAMLDTLTTLKANPSILAACVFSPARTSVTMVPNEKGEMAPRVSEAEEMIIAEYQRGDLNGSFEFPGRAATSQKFLPDRLDTFQDITLAGEMIGTFYVATDLTPITVRLQRSTTIVCAVMVGSLLLAFFLSSRLQKYISAPITHLAKTAGTVASQKDYSVRAVKETDDELGRLIDAFNEMLTQIQLQDSALQAARNTLEARVEERTNDLAKSLSLLNATLDSTADGIIAIQFSGQVASHNRQFAEMWDVPKELLDHPDKDELLKFLAEKTVHPEKFIQKPQDMNVGGEFFDVILLKSGQTFERYVKPQFVEGAQVGVVINFRDITARKQSEAKLAEANERLLSTSRQAGMAEVATSILHNVGNVLNSVGVSAEMAANKVNQFRIGSLKKLSALLQEHAADLPRFLTEDPRGKQLPEYLLKLTDHLAQPQQAILDELKSLGKNIEHIKTIVAMQQTYARGSGLMERIFVHELIEDSIRINEAGFVRHELNLTLEISNMEPIFTDRHKVLQILVNLLGNAKQALSEGVLEKKLTIRAARKDNTSIQISVVDNGVGIPPENLTKIFQHGFTTKKDGHGFGLHSGALAANELGGHLTAYSEGPGRGATFTLELPIDPKNAH